MSNMIIVLFYFSVASSLSHFHWLELLSHEYSIFLKNFYLLYSKQFGFCQKHAKIYALAELQELYVQKDCHKWLISFLTERYTFRLLMLGVISYPYV